MAQHQDSMVPATSPALLVKMPTVPATKAIDYGELCRLYLAALALTDGDKTKAKRMIEAHCVNDGYAVWAVLPKIQTDR